MTVGDLQAGIGREFGEFDFPRDPIFRAQGGTKALGRDAIAAQLCLYCAATCPSLKNKTVHPHTLRHTTAMRMLGAGIRISTIALWLGHECTQATQAYLHPDLGLKESAVARVAPSEAKGLDFSTGWLLALLETLYLCRSIHQRSSADQLFRYNLNIKIVISSRPRSEKRVPGWTFQVSFND